MTVDSRREGVPKSGYDYLVSLEVSRSETSETQMRNEYGVVSREWKGGGSLKCKTRDHGIVGKKTRCTGERPTYEEKRGVVG